MSEPDTLYDRLRQWALIAEPDVLMELLQEAASAVRVDRARVREPEEALLRDEWLTIDSAPRDHALPAIWVADLDGCMEPVRWRWRTWKNIYTDTDIGFEPTHWCPTPSPPPALREGGNG
jgi:hypothetical protein